MPLENKERLSLKDVLITCGMEIGLLVKAMKRRFWNRVKAGHKAHKKVIITEHTRLMAKDNSTHTC